MALSNFFWDNTEPVNGTLIPDGPLAWRYLIGNTSTLLGQEHETFPTDSNVGAWHKKGSAKTYHLSTASAPTVRPDGATAFDADDFGRLWWNTSTLQLNILTGVGPVAWTVLPALVAANTWAATQTFSLGFTSTVAPTWTAGVVAKDTYVTAVDQAGTGIVNLIRADSSDLPALPDGAVLEAATESGDTDRTIADKAYVDTEVKALSQSGYVNRSIATEYTASSDIIVIAYQNSETVSATMQALVSTTAGGSPTLVVQNYTHNGGFGVGIPNFTFAVPSGFKWRLNSSVAATVRELGKT
jgi:hypothetical protein